LRDEETKAHSANLDRTTRDPESTPVTANR
jgi:hypothetical protein